MTFGRNIQNTLVSLALAQYIRLLIKRQSWINTFGYGAPRLSAAIKTVAFVFHHRRRMNAWQHTS